MLKLLSKHASNFQQTYKIKRLEQQLAHANSYAEWQEIAHQLDQTSGIQLWKEDNSSIYFDSEVITHRLFLLKKYKRQGRVKDLISILHEGLTYDIANICHPMLFVVSYLGTKTIIEDYIHTVNESLKFIADVSEDLLSLDEKIAFFELCKIAYGQPALMFSGGATLGLFHSGVCKALKENDLLPNVLSGSSAGAIMTAMLGTLDSDRFNALSTGDQFYSQVFQFKSLKTLLKDPSGFTDVNYLKRFLQEHLGDLTFAEAHQKSGLDINIAVAPYNASQNPRVLNRYTSPDLLVWSAVLASCAVPILFSPIELVAKRHDGQHVPFMKHTRWVDGSVRSDFPQEKIARLYNVNYSIASQANPHVVPFMQSDVERYRQDLLSWPERIVRRQGKVFAKGVMDFTRERVGAVPQVRRILDHGYGIVDQYYYGDINIIGKYNLRHYGYLLQNPTPEIFKKLQKEGERATWPKLSMIEIYARIGKTLTQIYDDLMNQKTNVS